MRMSNSAIVKRLLCVGLVAAVMLPLGRMIFPHLGDAMTGTQFQTLEAIVSASLGYGIYALLG